MSTATWFEIRLRARRDSVDLLSALLDDQGYRALELRESAAATEIVVFKEGGSLDEAMNAAQRIVGALPAEALLEPPAAVSALDQEDWRENWKQHFPRLTVGRRLEISPPWESPQAREAGRLVVVINPGLAFGTGHHETTGACLELLDGLIDGAVSVADIGCGAGILAIAAAKLGAARVWAGDNDPQAVATARENALTNNVADQIEIVRADGPPRIATDGIGFDVVVANILAETLVSMATALTDCVKPGGTLVLSGIESSRRSLVEDALARRGWSVATVLPRGEWTTLALRQS